MKKVQAHLGKINELLVWTDTYAFRGGAVSLDAATDKYIEAYLLACELGVDASKSIGATEALLAVPDRHPPKEIQSAKLVYVLEIELLKMAKHMGQCTTLDKGYVVMALSLVQRSMMAFGDVANDITWRSTDRYRRSKR